MCEELDMPIRTSNAKKAQLKELKRYCKIQQVGHSLTIVDVFDTPLPRIESRGKTSVYGDLMQLLISDYLIEGGRTTTLITRNSMLKNIEMVNSNYSYGSRNVTHLSKYMNINQQTVYDFYNTSNSNFRSAFETALKNLRDKALIIYDTVTVVYCSVKKHRIAEEIEKEEILAIESKVLADMNFKDIPSVRISSRWGEFKKNISRHLKIGGKIEYYYTSYEITINMENLQSNHDLDLKSLLSKMDRNQKKSELNLLVCDRLLENAKKRRIAFNGDNSKRNRSEFNYPQDNNRLIELLIKSDAKDISEKIEGLKKLDRKKG